MNNEHQVDSTDFIFNSCCFGACQTHPNQRFVTDLADYEHFAEYWMFATNLIWVVIQVKL